MKRQTVALGLIIMTLGTLITGCGGNDIQSVSEAVASQVPKTANISSSHSSEAGRLDDAVLGAKLSYFDSKFGTVVKKENESTIGYMDGKLRVLENFGIAYTIYNAYVDRKEKVSVEDALTFIKQFLPKDAKFIKDEEDATTKMHKYTYKSEALKAQTQLSGQLIINIIKDPNDEANCKQAQISIDITAM
ncbi:hypothetical protein [Paenibacillus qinlingensis]|uniref:hypothetical protein n=1 Tax=Paenibacillus qinlingensis TaxID=1837343 RepID=UPI001566B108|nr:hypothetical protein [Paenibacillus qinlingensis]NQX63675.1 hypothetical protein [Paenibacillus qinlingensis]